MSTTIGCRPRCKVPSPAATHRDVKQGRFDSAPLLEERFLDLLERNRARISRLCGAFSRNQPELEDLRSEVALQLWRSLPSFDGRSREDTWLYRVTLNCALLHSRRRGRHPVAVPITEIAEPRALGELPDAELERHEASRRLREAVHRLAPADRGLLTLHLEQLPYREIAQVLGISENLVGVKLHRIRKRLAGIMTAHQGGAR